MMHRTIITGSFLAVLLVSALSLRAAEYSHTPSGLSLSLPDGWKVEQGDVLEINSPDEECNILVSVLKGAKELDAAVDEIDEALASELADVKVVGKPEVAEVGGLKAVIVTGTAKDKEEGEATVHWAAAIVVKGDKFVLVMALGTEDALKKHSGTTQKMFESLKLKD